LNTDAESRQGSKTTDPGGDGGAIAGAVAPAAETVRSGTGGRTVSAAVAGRRRTAAPAPGTPISQALAAVVATRRWPPEPRGGRASPDVFGGGDEAGSAIGRGRLLPDVAGRPARRRCRPATVL
jgi:hypothetical protein